MPATKQRSDRDGFSKSIVVSVLIHVAVFGSLAFLLGRHVVTKPTDDYLDLGYQTFDEAPPLAEKPKPMVHHVEEKAAVPEKVKQDVVTKPQEIQDEKGEVAGTQKEQKVAAQPVPSSQSGTQADVPFYKIKPKYPPSALIEGKEGWVLMKVDINETGTVENVRVVDGKEKNTFQSEARRAVEQWKYRPFLDPAGKPVPKRDHLVRVDFKLQEQGG